jgi:hypothetical protein
MLTIWPSCILCVGSVVAPPAWHPVRSTVVIHCLQWKWVDLVLEISCCLSPLGVAYYYLIYVAIPYYVAGFPVKYMVWIFFYKYDAYYCTITDDPFWVSTSCPGCSHWSSVRTKISYFSAVGSRNLSLSIAGAPVEFGTAYILRLWQPLELIWLEHCVVVVSKRHIQEEY